MTQPQTIFVRVIVHSHPFPTRVGEGSSLAAALAIS